MVTDPSLQGTKTLIVRRGIVESVDLYEIKDSELDTLEKGTSAELQLNFSIFLLSISFSAITSLFTATFTDPSVKTTYIVVAVVGILLGIYLMIAWWRAKSEVKLLCQTIRLRISQTELRAKATDEADEDDKDAPAGASKPAAPGAGAEAADADEVPKG